MSTSTIYSTETGFFVQDQEGKQPSADEILPRFGLIDDGKNRWTTFVAKIEELNSAAEPGTSFKVVFLGRHGQGYHNVAEAKYGSEAWDESWAKLNGDGEIVWGQGPTDWRRFIQPIPLPGQVYTSPLRRAIRTNQVTFGDDMLPPSTNKIIVENMRENHGIQTCDKRRTRSEIQAEFSNYQFEEGFTEEDELWKSDYRETRDDIDRRAKGVLDMIFRNDVEHFISITAHGGFINGFLRMCKHRPWLPPTGGVIPVVVKGSKTQEREEQGGSSCDVNSES